MGAEPSAAAAASCPSVRRKSQAEFVAPGSAADRRTTPEAATGESHYIACASTSTQQPGIVSRVGLANVSACPYDAMTAPFLSDLCMQERRGCSRRQHTQRGGRHDLRSGSRMRQQNGILRPSSNKSMAAYQLRCSAMHAHQQVSQQMLARPSCSNVVFVPCEMLHVCRRRGNGCAGSGQQKVPQGPQRHCRPSLYTG